MDKTSKYEYVRELQKLLNLTGPFENLKLTYGAYDMTTNIFTPSSRDLDRKDDPRETVRLELGSRTIYKSVEMDNLYALTLDVMDTCRHDLLV